MVRGLTPPSKNDDFRTLQHDVNNLRDTVIFTGFSRNQSDATGYGMGGSTPSVPSVRGLFALDVQTVTKSIILTYDSANSVELKIGDTLESSTTDWEGELIGFVSEASDTEARIIIEPTIPTTPDFTEEAQTLTTSDGFSASYVLLSLDENILPLKTSSAIVNTIDDIDPIIDLISGTLNNGQFITLKPVNGKILTLTSGSGGNIDISSDVVINDNQIVILQFHKDNINASADGSYTVVVDTGSGGGSQTPWLQDVNADGFDLYNLDRLAFFDGANAPRNADDVTIYMDAGQNMVLNVADADSFKFSFETFTGIQFVEDTSFDIMQLRIVGDPANVNSKPSLNFRNTTTLPTGSLLQSEISFEGTRTGNSASVQYAYIDSYYEDVGVGTHSGSMLFGIHENGIASGATYLTFNDNETNQIEIWKDFNAKTFDILNVDRLTFADDANVPIANTDVTIYQDTNQNMLFNIDNDDQFTWTFGNNIGMLFDENTGQSNRTLILQSDIADQNGITGLVMKKLHPTPVTGLAIGGIFFDGRVLGNGLTQGYAEIVAEYEDVSGIGSFDGSLRFTINGAGGNQGTYIRLNDASSNQVDLLRDTDLNSFDLLNVDRLQFALSGGVAIASTDVTIYKDGGDNMVLNIDNDDQFTWTFGNNIGMTLDENISSRTLTLQSDLTDINGITALQMKKLHASPFSGSAIGGIFWDGRVNGSGLTFGFAEIVAEYEDVTSSVSYSGSMRFTINGAGGNQGTFMQLNDGDSNNIDMRRALNMNDNEIRFDGMADPSTIAGEPQLFADLSNSDHLSIRSGDGSVIDLETGGGGTSFIGFTADDDLEMGSFDIDMEGNTLILDTDGDTHIESFSDDSMQFVTGGSPRFSIQNSGTLTVGTMSLLSGNFDVGGNDIISVDDITMSGSGSILNMNNGDISNVDVLDFNSSGSLIQQIDTIIMLDSGASIDMNAGTLILDSDGDTHISSLSDDSMQFVTGGSPRFSIQNSGTLTVGTMSLLSGNLDMGGNNIISVDDITMSNTSSVLDMNFGNIVDCDAFDCNNCEIDGALNHDGSTVGFYGVTPTTRPTWAAIPGGASLLTVIGKINELAADLEDTGIIDVV